MDLNICKYICLDEADRMMDVGFDEDVQNISVTLNTRDKRSCSAQQCQKDSGFCS